MAAIAQEARKPKGTRTRTGRVLGVVPYDFRFPTPWRWQQRVWAPRNPSLINPAPFGVGWTLNLGRVAVLVREVARR